MKLVKIINAGKKIKETNFWDSELAKYGKFYCSINAGCIRLLVPDNQVHLLSEMKTGKKVILSRGPWPQMGVDDGFEIMFEDYSNCPFSIHVGTESWDLLPDQNTTGSKWQFAIWTRSGCMYQSKCYYRIVDEIPHMKPWEK